MTGTWKVNLFSLATTAGVFYILCAIFDAPFPPFGLIAAVSTHSPWPLLEPAQLPERICDVRRRGLAPGALYGIAWDFWNKRLREQRRT